MVQKNNERETREYNAKANVYGEIIEKLDSFYNLLDKGDAIDDFNLYEIDSGLGKIKLFSSEKVYSRLNSFNNAVGKIIEIIQETRRSKTINPQLDEKVKKAFNIKSKLILSMREDLKIDTQNVAGIRFQWPIVLQKMNRIKL